MGKKINIHNLNHEDVKKFFSKKENAEAFVEGIEKGLRRPKLNKLTGLNNIYSADMFIIYPDNSRLN